MVQRYEFKDVDASPHHPYYEMVKSDKGEWVGYEDYKELDDYYQERLAYADKEIEGLVTRLAEVNAELQKYRDLFLDYVECANCRSITHVEGAEDVTRQSGCQIGEHYWVLDPDEDYFVRRVCGETT